MGVAPGLALLQAPSQGCQGYFEPAWIGGDACMGEYDPSGHVEGVSLASHGHGAASLGANRDPKRMTRCVMPSCSSGKESARALRRLSGDPGMELARLFTTVFREFA